jgi:hypothetical protein
VTVAERTEVDARLVAGSGDRGPFVRAGDAPVGTRLVVRPANASTVAVVTPTSTPTTPPTTGVSGATSVGPGLGGPGAVAALGLAVVVALVIARRRLR